MSRMSMNATREMTWIDPVGPDVPPLFAGGGCECGCGCGCFCGDSSTSAVNQSDTNSGIAGEHNIDYIALAIGGGCGS